MSYLAGLLGILVASASIVGMQWPGGAGAVRVSGDVNRIVGRVTNASGQPVPSTFITLMR